MGQEVREQDRTGEVGPGEGSQKMMPVPGRVFFNLMLEWKDVKNPELYKLYVHPYELYMNYMLLPAGEFCSGLEQREQATGTECGTVKMSIGMSGSKVPRNVIWLLVHLSVFIKKEKRRIFSYFTDAYPLAKSISLQRFKVSSETNQALGTLLHCIHMFMKTILAYKHGPTGSLGKMTSKLHSAVTQRPMIYVLQTLHGCER